MDDVREVVRLPDTVRTEVRTATLGDVLAFLDVVEEEEDVLVFLLSVVVDDA